MPAKKNSLLGGRRSLPCDQRDLVGRWISVSPLVCTGSEICGWDVSERIQTVLLRRVRASATPSSVKLVAFGDFASAAKTLGVGERSLRPNPPMVLLSSCTNASTGWPPTASRSLLSFRSMPFLRRAGVKARGSRKISHLSVYAVTRRPRMLMRLGFYRKPVDVRRR